MLTRITDTIKLPDGNLFNGTLRITLNGTRSQPLYNDEGVSLGGLATVITVVDGAVDIELESNAAIIPRGTYYTVQAFVGSLRLWSEWWYLPTSETALELREVRTNVLPATGANISPTQLLLPLGQMIIGTAEGNATRLAAGVDGYILTMVTGSPAWAIPAVPGLADTATRLATPRAINGVNFDGTAAITVTAAAGTLTGATLAANVLASSLTSFGTSPTLVTPTIANFTNAGHNHTNAANGGTLTLAGAAFANQGTSTQVLHGNAAGNPTWGSVVLTTDVSGILPNANTTATALNTVSAIVARDGSGNFAAGTITATITGNASTATALATPRAINGVNFDGTAAITVTAAAGTLTGATLAANVLASSLTSFGTSPTLVTPTIANFTNAGHNHTNAANGGTLTLAGAAFANQGTSTQVLHGNAAGNPTWGAVVLTTDVSGVLPNANTTATALNTGSAIVARDGSGNFAAGTITATIAGNASTATALATSIPSTRVMFGNGTGVPATNSGFTWTAATGRLTLGSLVIHTYADPAATGQNTFLGVGAGNETMATPGSPTYTSYNTGVGYGALAGITTAFRTAAFGTLSLNANTTGPYNTAFGAFSLSKVTTAGSNSAFGSDAMRENLGGFNNAAFGTSALLLNTSGYSNSAFGNLALSANLDGFMNVAVGDGALKSNTSGTRNTGLGYNALGGNTTGIQNVAIGEGTLPVATGTQYNVAIGPGALYNHTSGDNNTVVGVSSMLAHQTGGFNTAIGQSTLQSSTTGISNIAIGWQAADSLLTGNYNIVIGNNIDLPSTSSSNMLNIGNLIYGTGIDGTGTTISTGNVGIGFDAPSERLDIAKLSSAAKTSVRITNTSTSDSSASVAIKFGHRSTALSYAAEIRSFRTANWDGNTANHTAGLVFDVVNAGTQIESLRLLPNGMVAIGGATVLSTVYIGPDTSQSYITKNSSDLYFRQQTAGLFHFSNGTLFVENGLIKIGGLTSSSPMLKKSSAILQARLADDSAFTQIQTSRIITDQTTPAASTDAGTAGAIWADATYIYVQTGASTVKRIALTTF